jgi:hypothetical protein
MVAVHPPLVEFLSQDRADRLADEGLFADEPQGLAGAWPRICEMWEATVAGARQRPPWQLEERVDGEWSFVETLRHLVHVTDVWVRDVIEEAESPYHPWGTATSTAGLVSTSTSPTGSTHCWPASAKPGGQARRAT